MLRGINRQDIFNDDEDFHRFLQVLYQMVCPSDEITGKQLPARCIFYAYCVMTNHVHLLVRESSENLASVIKRIAVSYAHYYNKKYLRYGHLFQDRFKSEPVNDSAYFFTLLQYIHQNPVAAGMTANVSSYPWSSFDHYVDAPRLVDNRMALQLLGPEGFAEFHEYIDLASVCLDVDSGRRMVPNEEMYTVARAVLQDVKVEEIAGLERGLRDDALRKLKRAHLSIRQIERMTGVPKSVVSRA